MDKKNSSAKKKPKRRFFSRQFETVFLVLIVLSAFSVVLFIVIDNIFPNNGGFTRNILFIKPNQDGDPTYFIAIDDIYPTSDNIPVDWILHGRGNLTVFNNNQSAVWSVNSYLNSDNVVKLYAIFIEPQVTISESTGPFYPTQTYKHNPIMLPFIKARPTQTGPTRFITILYPLNESQTLPTITTNAAQGVTYIGSNDLLFSQDSAASQNFDNFTTNAPLLFLRSDGENISSFIMKKGSHLSDQNRTYVSSQNTISINLEYQSSNISGMIWVSSPTQISLWVPDDPKQTIFNGENLSDSYNPATHMDTFTIVENGSIFISHDPVKSQPPPLPPPAEKPEPPTVKNGPPETYGPHPYLYFNETTLPTLRNQVLTQQPWQGWFAKIETNADSHLDDDISTVGSSTRFISALDLAFTGVMRLNMTYINKSKAFLLAMDDITDYSSHLERGSACGHYSVAFDMIYQNLTLAEQVEIANKLGNHTLPLLEKFDYLPRNNHIAIVASGLGLSGLVLEKNDWVSRAITGVDDYFATSFASDGGNYEGYSYAGFFLHTGLKFFNALKNLGGKNYFAEPKFISFINNTIYCLSPLMIIPLFEDSGTQAEIIEALLWSAAPIYPHAPLLSNYSQWIWEMRQLNDVLSYDGTYLESHEILSYYSGLVTRVCMYSMNITAVQPILDTTVVNRDSGLAFLRSDWNQDALYLSITCKSKSQYQYHAHYDENSFEIWAYGAWLATNPGYPGFGYGEYDYITSTEASNTLLLNEENQQQVNGDGFQEHFSSPTLDGVVASANSIYSSPGHFAMNNYFLGVLIFILTNLVAALIILIYLRRRAYKTNIVLLPAEEQKGVAAVRSKNLSLKIHLTLIFGLSLGIILSLVSFYLFVNPYVQVYVVGKHEEIMSLIPIIQIALLVLVIPGVLLILFFKFKMQNSLVRRIAIFSSNLKAPQIPPLKDTIKYSYLPQTLFLIIFIPIMIFLYVPLVNGVVNHIFTSGASLVDIENFMINTLNTFILLFALTLLLYLPFKIIGIYLGGRDISEKLRQPTSDSMLMLTASYLLTLTVFILVIFFLSLVLFYALNFLGISFIV
ncbi:MAG: heparinase II/III family protein [Candidatus Helarchaeota archaeon]|nr:heparinase II/III family protein [Candidatus Helarchaeota archaeon]